MSGIAKNSPIFHECKIFLVNHLVTSRYRYKEISHFGRFFHRHYVEAVHNRFNRLDRVDLRHDHPCAKPFGPHRRAFAAPSVTGNYHDLARHDQVCRSVDSIPYGLTRTVSIVK